MKTNDMTMLQMFADAGTLVSTTTGYVNSATGAVTGFDGANSLSGEMKTFYESGSYRTF